MTGWHGMQMLDSVEGPVHHLAYERGEDVIVMKGYKFAKAKTAAAATLGCLALANSAVATQLVQVLACASGLKLLCAACSLLCCIRAACLVVCCLLLVSMPWAVLFPAHVLAAVWPIQTLPICGD